MRSKKNIILTSLTITFLSCFTYVISQTKPTEPKPKITQDTVKMVKPDILAIPTDSVFTDKGLKLKPYKKNAHASYYADRFNGKKTASGARFSNSKYTAAHKKLPFGTR
jgi:rare lipoprotein A